MNKNVVFITIDGLRFDRTGISGYQPSPSPTLDRLADESLCLENCFSTGCTTQFAMPSIYTSTLPLDKSGYEYGIRDREKSFVEILQGHGYRTAGFYSAFYGTSFFSYDRGYDDFFELIRPQFIQNFKRNYLNHFKHDLEVGAKSIDECVTTMEQYLIDYLQWVLQYIDQKIVEKSDNATLLSPIIHGWNFPNLGRTVEEDLRRIKEDPKRYIESILGDGKWFGIVNLDYGIRNMTRFGLKFHLFKLFNRNGLRTAMIKELLAGNIRSKEEFSQLKHITLNGFDRVASGAYMVTSAINWIDANKNSDRPFFIWFHLMDVHDERFVSNDLDIDAGDAAAERKELKVQYEMIRRKGAAYQGNLTKDLSLKYTDIQLRRIVDFLEKSGLNKNTLLVISSDHGSRKYGAPRRPSIDLDNFFDEMYHIPALFIAPDTKPERIAGLFSTLDVGPTILSFLDIPPDASFKGQSVLERPDGWPYLIAENMGRGPCDFSSKPINVCVRSMTHKIVYTVPQGKHSADGKVRQYFDLQTDKNESTNLADRFDMVGDRILKEIAIERVNEIRAGLSR